jgi:CSLREA domain-containing protein
MGARSRTLFSLLGAVALSLAAMPVAPPAYAAQISVTTTADELTQNGQCSLREAIRNANADARVHPDCPAGNGADVIVLQPGTYKLSIPSAGGEAAIDGDLDVTGDLTISGQDATVDGNELDRVFEIRSGTTTINRLTIRKGFTPEPGGGLRVAPDATAELHKAVVDSNRAGGGGGGGGISNDGGTLRLVDTTVRDNFASDGDGGGILTAGGTTITGGLVAGNRAIGTGAGGGIYQAGGTLKLSHATIRDNRASTGGGIFRAAGTLTATQTTVANNTPDNCQPDNLIPGCT